MEVISLWHCWGGMEAQVSLTVVFRSSALLGLVSLIFLLTIPHRFSMGFRSGEFAGQSSTVTPWSLNQLLVPLAVWAGASPAGKWNQHLHKACQQKEAWSALKSPGRWLRWLWTSENTVDQHQQMTWQPKSSHDCGNFTLDFKQHGFCASPLFLQTLGPWFPNEMQNLLSSERGLWTTEQQSSFFFLHSPGKMLLTLSLVQKWLGRPFPEDVWAWWLLMHWLQLQVHSLWSSHKCLNQLAWLYSQACGHPCCLCTFSYQSTLHLICFDTALCKQPHLSVMTLCDLPSLSEGKYPPMFVFWIIAKSAVFPIIVVSKNKRYPEFILYVWSLIETQM